MQVILIRHTSVAVPRGTCYGQTDVPVNDTFTDEAALTLQGLQPYLPVDAVFSSPLTRARKLAAFCGYPSPTVDDRLMEMNMGQWEMQLYDKIQDPCLQEWYKDYMHLPTPGGEAFPDLMARVGAFLDELRTASHERVAIFAHGGVLIAAGLYAGLFDEQDAWDHLAPFGGIMTIEL
ncbi:MAG: alpha-ribazole phosphatase family protein [Muribaculaceae bacterium]|nr:alpha-ribazole phosphatase family protein [Muribaculaceae bacterium]